MLVATCLGRTPSKRAQNMRHPFVLSLVASTLSLAACSVINDPAPPSDTKTCAFGLPDPNSCSYRFCDGNDKSVEVFVSEGVPCDRDGGRVCDGQGNCVACVTDQDCGATESCQSSSCVEASCVDGQENGDETDVDCGGSCTPCGPSKHCVEASDCISEVCVKLAGEGVCDLPRCDDGVKNGNESDIDCGGAKHAAAQEACARCQQGQLCEETSDCQEGLTCDKQRCVLKPLENNPEA